MSIQLKGTVTLLQVFDMPASLHFYRDVLGFRVMQQAPNQTDDSDWVYLSHNGIELMLNTAYEKTERPPLPDPKRVTSHGDVIIYFGAPDVEAVYGHLKEHGIDAKEPEITGYNFKSVTTKDPDGYIIAFQCPNS